MKRTIFVASLLVALVVIFTTTVTTQGESGITQAPRIHERGATSTSTNWSGYAVETNLGRPQNGTVTDVKGTWVVPSVTATNTNSYSAIWVGIDGYSSNTVEQLGTEEDWINGSPVYSAWWEMYPGASYTITSITVNPGDTIIAEVNYIGSGSFTLSMTDLTTRQPFTITRKSNSAKRSSAEWIVEAPWMGGILPLADFGTATFSSASTTLKGVTGAISNPNWQNTPINMVNSSGGLKAQTGALSTDGTGFGVKWVSSN